MVNNNALGTAGNILNLTTAALDLVNSSNPVNKLAHAIVKWLGRECISESDFEYCIVRCRALAHPNENGLEIRKSILRSQEKVLKVGGIQLISSGAIGRLMAFSQEHAYMVTTVAAATKYHKLDFATELLCEMALTDKDDSLEKGEIKYSYSVDRARLMGVLSKFADSIYLNVVIAGHTLGDLPKELQSFCVHLTDAATFARMVLKISRSPMNLLLRCGRFQSDLLLWILAHFEGEITVSVAGKELFRRSALHGERLLRIVVEKTCDEENCRAVPHRIELLELLGTSWSRVLDSNDDPSRIVINLQRHPLYTTELPEVRLLLNREEKYKVQNFAQRLVTWMLDLPILPGRGQNIAFRVNFSEKSSANQMRVADILCRSPKLLNLDGRNIGKSGSLVFLEPKSDSLAGSDLLYISAFDQDSVLCSCFPGLEDLLDEISNRCNCRICVNGGSIDDCRDGCLRHAAITQMLMLMAHTIADGFGADDVSGGFKTRCTDVVRTILHQLVEGTIWWDYWFNVAASTILGYLPTGILARSRHEGANALVAVQFGSLVVAAKWLDLTQRIRPAKCFALEVAEGQIPGAQESVAFLFSEIKMELSCDLNAASAHLSMKGDSLPLKELSERDSSSPFIEHAIIGTPDSTILRLITFISCGASQRIIDPSDALVAAIWSSFIEKKVPCQHQTHGRKEISFENENPVKDETHVKGGSQVGDNVQTREKNEAGDDANPIYIWPFEELLINWETENVGKFFSISLDTELKFNVALSLSKLGCIARDSSSCVLCALEKLNTLQHRHHQRIISYQVKVMSLSPA